MSLQCRHKFGKHCFSMTIINKNILLYISIWNIDNLKFIRRLSETHFEFDFLIQINRNSPLNYINLKLPPQFSKKKLTHIHVFVKKKPVITFNTINTYTLKLIKLRGIWYMCVCVCVCVLTHAYVKTSRTQNIKTTK